MIGNPMGISIEDRGAPLAAVGCTGRDAEWIALVCLHSGVFTRAQWRYFYDDPHRELVKRFVHRLVEKKMAFEDHRAIFPGAGRAVFIPYKPFYRALGIGDVRHRRGKETTTEVLMRRVLSLDYIIERPTLGWLPTEDEKVQRFEALGIDRAVLPCRYGTSEKAQPRYFAHKLPIAVDEKAATFVYVASGQTTASELRTWGAEHAPLWAALRALSFAVHVVAVGAGPDAASRAELTLSRWKRDGDVQGPTTPTTPAEPTRADPEIQQETDALTKAVLRGDVGYFTRYYGGTHKATTRLVYLQTLPAGTPTPQTKKAAIDRYSVWTTRRLFCPEIGT